MKKDRQGTDFSNRPRGVRRRAVLILVLATAVVLGMTTAAAAEEAFDITTVLSGDGVWEVVSDGDRVVWFTGSNAGEGGGSLNTWTPTDGVVLIATNPISEMFDPQVSGDRVVWYANASETGQWSQVYTWTPGDGPEQIVHEGWDDYAAKIDGDRVVWEGWPDGWDENPGQPEYDSEIFTWTATAALIQQLTGVTEDPGVYDGTPDVSGDRVVWSASELESPYGNVGLPSTDIMTMVVGDESSRQQLDDPDNHYMSQAPRVSGDRVVWFGMDGAPIPVVGWDPDLNELIYGEDPDGDPTTGDWEVYTWTPASGRVQVTDNSTVDGMPEVDGNRVTYWGESSVFTWTPTEGETLVEATGSEYESGPQVSGDRVVYPGSVNTWTPGAGTTQVSDTEAVDYWNVSGDRLFWCVRDGEDHVQIFTAIPGVEASIPAPTPAATAGSSKRYEQTDPFLVYYGKWETGSNNSYSAGFNSLSGDQEATITITFKGTRLDWIAALGPLMGKALVSIDGGEPVLVDLFSATELFQQLAWSTGDLAYGVHVITITFPANGGEVKLINIDALDVWGTIIETTES
jgi:hypothetical protein